MDYKNLGSLGTYLQNSAKFSDVRKFFKEGFAKTGYAAKKSFDYLKQPKAERKVGLAVSLGSLMSFLYSFNQMANNAKAGNPESLEESLISISVHAGIIYGGLYIMNHADNKERKCKGMSK